MCLSQNYVLIDFKCVFNCVMIHQPDPKSSLSYRWNVHGCHLSMGDNSCHNPISDIHQNNSKTTTTSPISKTIILYESEIKEKEQL